MDYLFELLIGATPLLGGFVLGALAVKYLRPPDGREPLKNDLDLVDRLPVEQTERRIELQRSIDLRVDDLIVGVHRDRAMRAAALAYRGNVRDVVMFVSTLLFSYIWWHADHSKAEWLPAFVVLILFAFLAFGYATRGAVRAVAAYFRTQRDTRVAAGEGAAR